MAKQRSITIPIRGEKLSMSVEVKEEVHSRKTEFQEILIIDTEAFGRMLLLDGHVQLAELDEAAYHESLVHPAALSIVEPKRALVVGGGDGGVIRELRKHPSLERIDLVEIDPGVIEACLEFMPFLSGGAFQDPRVVVHLRDAFEFVKRARTPYDLIVMDSTDVYEEEDGGLSERLFSQQFFADCRSALSEEGIVVTQADNPLFCPYSLEAIQADFGKVFEKTGSYFALVPSFGGYSAFAWGSMGAEVDPRIKDARSLKLQYLNGPMCELAFRDLPFQRES